MTNLAPTNQTLHQFPLLPEVEGLDFTTLAETARDRLAPHIGITTLEYSPVLSYKDNSVFVKRTDELDGGNFKSHSAKSAVADLMENGHEDFSLATAGSYGIGVAYAVQLFGGRPIAFVPENSNKKKQAMMLDMGVDVREYGANFDEALEEARRYSAAHKITLLHPFADVRNFAGTGIIGLEILEQCPDMDYLVTQFGGGSLTCGVGGVVKQQRPDVELVVAQAAACDPFVKAVETGDTEPVTDPMKWGRSYFNSLGGVGVGKTDPMTLGLGSHLADKTVRVQLNEVYATMHDFEQEHGVLPEAAAAHGLEAARQLARTPGLEGATIVAVLTGANPDDYPTGYLAAASRRRQSNENTPPVLISSR